MPDKARRIIAWIAVGFIFIFFVSLIFVMSLSDFLMQEMRAIALISGVLGLTLWLLLKIDSKSKNENSDEKIKEILKKGSESNESQSLENELTDKANIDFSKTDKDENVDISGLNEAERNTKSADADSNSHETKKEADADSNSHETKKEADADSNPHETKKENDELKKKTKSAHESSAVNIDNGSEILFTRVLLFSKDNIQKAAKTIRLGEVVAFGTETVYGLGADAFNPEAVKKVFEAKCRPADNPLIVHLSKVEDIEQVAVITNEQKELLKQIMPSALTVILPKKTVIPDIVTAGLKTVGVRVPKSEKTRAFLAECGTPVAAPSANRSGRPSPTSAAHVLDDLSGKIPIILDCGSCVIGLESTVLDLTAKPPTILRQGGLTKEELIKYFPDVVLSAEQTVLAPKSPGQKYRHYAPNIPLKLFRADDIEGLKLEYGSIIKENKKPVILALEEQRQSIEEREFCSLGENADSAGVSLFDTLRRIENKYDIILAIELDNFGMGASVNSRLKKASDS